jgi:hypothetical protein
MVNGLVRGRFGEADDTFRVTGGWIPVVDGWATELPVTIRQYRTFCVK